MSYSIAGARGTIQDPGATVARALDWATQHGGEVLLADATVVFGRDHLETSVRHALRAQAAGRIVAHSLSMETLRYIAARRQVSEAIAVAGIRSETKTIAIVTFGPASPDRLIELLGWRRDDDVLKADRKSIAILGITEEEAATIPEERRADLVLEKVALLDIPK